MSALSELEMRILSELEEAGQEDVFTLMVTVMNPSGEASEVEQMCEALSNLVRAGLVRMSVDRDVGLALRELPQDESLLTIAELAPNLRFQAEGGYWTDIRRTGRPFEDTFPYVLGTETGIARAFEILTERGYQWWRPTK